MGTVHHVYESELFQQARSDFPLIIGDAMGKASVEQLTRMRDEARDGGLVCVLVLGYGVVEQAPKIAFMILTMATPSFAFTWQGDNDTPLLSSITYHTGGKTPDEDYLVEALVEALTAVAADRQGRP